METSHTKPEGDDLDSMTGLEGGTPPAIVLDQLSLNGDAEIQEVAPGKFATKGGFFRVLKLKDAKKDEKPEEEKLGASVDVVFLKIRRVLQQRSTDGKLVAWTNEHNTPDDIVELKVPNSSSVEIGSARALREAHPELRTIQFVYALLLRSKTSEPELVKIKIRGSALGSEAKAKDVPTFYDYIYTERKTEDGKKDHLRHHITTLGCVKEEGRKTYFTMTFTFGPRLPQEWCDLADQTLRDIHAKITAIDNARDGRIAALKAKGQEHVDTEEVQKHQTEDIQYPEGEEVNPEDIPF